MLDFECFYEVGWHLSLLPQLGTNVLAQAEIAIRWLLWLPVSPDRGPSHLQSHVNPTIHSARKPFDDMLLIAR